LVKNRPIGVVRQWLQWQPLIKVRPSFEIIPGHHPAPRRRPPPGGIAGAQFKQQDSHHGSAFGGGACRLRDITHGYHVKSTKGPCLHVTMETAVDLIVNFPNLYRTHVLGSLQGSMKT